MDEFIAEATSLVNAVALGKDGMVASIFLTFRVDVLPLRIVKVRLAGCADAHKWFSRPRERNLVKTGQDGYIW